MRTFSFLPSQAVCKALGQRVRARRLALNLSQSQLAQMCEASLSSVRRLEASGQGSVELLVRAVQALQAADGLETLLATPEPSLADLERQHTMPPRQRARQAKATP